MEKVKEKLHLRRKSKPENEFQPSEQEVRERESIDSELAAMAPSEREAYLKEFDDAEKTGEPKKGSLIDKLIARGNKRTEDQIAQETEAKRTKDVRFA